MRQLRQRCKLFNSAMSRGVHVYLQKTVSDEAVMIPIYLQYPFTEFVLLFYSIALLVCSQRKVDHALPCFCCSSPLAFDFPIRKKKPQKTQKTPLVPVFTSQFIINITPCLTVIASQARPQLHDTSKTFNDFSHHHIPPPEIQSAWA